MNSSKQDKFHAQCELARKELGALGIPAQRIHPVTHKVFGLLGIHLKPPFYSKALSNFFIFTLFNTLLFLLLFYLIFGLTFEYDLLVISQAALFVGSLAGGLIARLYRLGYERHNLKPWAELGARVDTESE